METLAGRIARDEALTEVDAASWVVRLAKALELLHARGAAHGNISPEAILTVGPARTGRGVLADPRRLHEVPQYHSPERTIRHTVSPEDDTWAAAVTLYFLLTRTLPFPGADEREVRRRFIAGPASPLSAFDVGDERLQAILDVAFSRNLSGRMKSMRELREQLEQWLVTHSVRGLAALEEDTAPAPAPAPVIEAPRAQVPAVYAADDEEDGPTKVRDVSTLAAHLSALQKQTVPPAAPQTVSEPPPTPPVPPDPGLLTEAVPTSARAPASARGQAAPASTRAPAPAPAPAPAAAADRESVPTRVGASHPRDMRESVPTPVVPSQGMPREVRESVPTVAYPSTSKGAEPGKPAESEGAPGAGPAPVLPFERESAPNPPPGPAKIIPFQPDLVPVSTAEPAARPLSEAPPRNAPIPLTAVAPRRRSSTPLVLGLLVVLGAAGVGGYMMFGPKGPPRDASSEPTVVTAVASGTTSAPPTTAMAKPTAVATLDPSAAPSAPVTAAPTASATASTSAAPSSSASPGNAAACMVPLFAPGTFAEPLASLNEICEITDPRRGAEVLKTQVVLGGQHRLVSDGMREWAIMGWYDMAGFATIRTMCCPSAKDIDIPFGVPTCDIESALRTLAKTASSKTATDDEVNAALEGYTKAAKCTARAGAFNAFGQKGGIQEGELVTFQKTLARVREAAKKK